MYIYVMVVKEVGVICVDVVGFYRYKVVNKFVGGFYGFFEECDDYIVYFFF